MTATQTVSRDAIARTAAIIRPHIRRTPIMDVDLAEFGLAPAPVALKLEFLQHSGSFKARGAFANLLTRTIGPAGVAAASGGNHGAAVAYAAQKLGVPASIFVPEVAPQAKRQKIAGYGARLVIAGERYADALAACEAFVAETGATSVHAFEQAETMLGQGGVGWELEEQRPDIDTLLVAVGGGGLIGGIAAWYGDRVKVVSVEPEEAPTLNMALAAGHPVDAPTGGIAADSLAPKQVGSMMFAIARKHIGASILVEDQAIRAAQQALWDRMRIVAEPGGAAAFAALLSGRYTPKPGERVAVLLCGANTDAVKFA